MRIGIYGGTFNPIHTAHVHLVREFIKRLSLDRVILIPTGTPPHKATHQLASGADRIEMCRLAAADIAECPVTVSDIEVLRTGKSYTADTMTELKAQYPDDELFLLMGEDMFCTVKRSCGNFSFTSSPCVTSVWKLSLSRGAAQISAAAKMRSG